MEMIKEYNYRFEIISTVTKSFAFNVKTTKEDGLNNYVDDLLNMFASEGENGEMKIEALQEYNNSIKKKIGEFVDKYRDLFPELNGVKAQFNLIPNGKYFCFMPKIELDVKTRLTVINHLRSKNDGLNFDDLQKNTQETVGKLVELYYVGAFGSNRVRIGEHKREKRVCRFCRKKVPEVSFKNKAHAISESLGNKLVILLEECDSCNIKFSKIIEPDIVQYLSLYRTMYGVKAKGGKKGLKEKNFTFKEDPSLVLTLKNAVRPTEHTLPYKVQLDYDQKMTLQNIYRCLCKYFVSVIEAENLPYFADTIKWINRELNIEQLPRIAELIDYGTFAMEPQLITYIRKTDNEQFPFAIGELRFTCKRFIFIIPAAKAKEVDFTNKENYDLFWNGLPHYKAIEAVSFNDFSSDKARDLVLKLNGNLEKPN